MPRVLLVSDRPGGRRGCFRLPVAWCLTALLSCSAGCGGGGNPTQPSQSPSPSGNFSGTWQGTVSSSVTGGTLNVSLTLTQTSSSISGTFSCSFGTASCVDSTGTVTGTVTGTTVSARLIFRNGQLCDSFSGALSGETMTGTYSCTNTDRGTWAVRRATTIVCSIALSENAVTFERNGGSRSVNVQASDPSCAWQAVSNAPWLRITAGTSGVGSGVVSYQVDAHTGSSAREGTIGIDGQTLTVRQSDAGCRYCPSPTSRTVSSAGGTFSISVDPVTNPDGTLIEWNATADQPWLRVTSGQSGRGRGTVTYVVDRNTSSATKTGIISVGGLSGIFPRETHVVTQQP